MYKISVPMFCTSGKRLESAAEQLRLAKADTVFLVFDRVLCSDEMLSQKLELFETFFFFLQNSRSSVDFFLSLCYNCVIKF